MYPFRKDNGEIVELSFEDMMDARDGVATLPDGTFAKRVHTQVPREKPVNPINNGIKPIVSDSMGFTQSQLGEMESLRTANGHHGIEFKQDPDCDTFMQVHCSDQKAKDRWMKQLGMADYNSKNGSSAMLTGEQLESAKKRILEKHPLPC